MVVRICLLNSFQFPFIHTFIHLKQQCKSKIQGQFQQQMKTKKSKTLKNQLKSTIARSKNSREKSTSKKQEKVSHDMNASSSFHNHLETKKKIKSSKLQKSPSSPSKQKSKDRLDHKRNQKSISRQSSIEHLEKRLPWGSNEPRIQNYVLETLAKMSKLRKTQQILKTQSRQKLIEGKKKKTKTIETPQRVKIKGITVVREKKAPEEKTQKKQSKFNSENQAKKFLYYQIRSSFKNQFQKIEENNLFHIQFKIIRSPIIQFKIEILKKLQAISIALKKANLQCQSIYEQYTNVSPKTIINLMSPIKGMKADNFAYPELLIVFTEKNGTFSFQKNVLIPFSWLHLVLPLSPEELKNQTTRRLKNRSIIEDVVHGNQLQCLMNIFSRNFLKISKDELSEFKFGFSYLQSIYILRFYEKGEKYSLECEVSDKGDPSQALKYFDFILNY